MAGVDLLLMAFFRAALADPGHPLPASAFSLMARLFHAPGSDKELFYAPKHLTDGVSCVN